MTEFTITLPMPPSVNQLYTGMGKNRRKHPNYSAWCNEAGWRMNEQKAAGAFTSLLPDVWYWTDVSLPENHLGDSDNRLKALHDLLHEMGATPDDKWLLGGTFMRCPDVVSGTCVVHAVSVPGGAKAQMDQLRFLAERFGSVVGDGVGDNWQHIGDVARRLVKGQIG